MIPVNEPLLTEAEFASVMGALRSGWISGAGPDIDAFEQRWAAYCGRKYGVAVANGSLALHLAVSLLDLAPGDEVILPSFTIISCVWPIILAGAIPVLVDSDARTWTMNVEQVRRKITPRTRAIMPVHIYGNPVDMQPLQELAQEHGLHIVEDAAEAHGGEYRGRKIGSFGTASCFSFYANKLITTGEGGMVLMDDDALVERARRFRNLGFQPGRRFVHAELGFNFRLTNLQAALGLTQVERIDSIVARKRAMANAYTERLSQLKGLELQLEQTSSRSVYWMYGLLVRESTGLDAAELGRRLAQRGIETRPFFFGMHEQPVLRERGLFVGETYPVTERLARQGLYLPSSIGLDEARIDCICATVREALE